MSLQNHIPLFPLGVVLLPNMRMPLHIFEERYKLMIQECLDHDQEFGMVYWKDGNIQRVGCSARITEVLRRYEDGRMDILTVGGKRFLITAIDESRPFLQASVVTYEGDLETPEPGLLQRSMKAVELLKALNRVAGREEGDDPPEGADASLLSFFIAGHDVFTFDERQELLELASPSSRIEKEIEWLSKKIERLKDQEEIRKIVGGNGKVRHSL